MDIGQEDLGWGFHFKSIICLCLQENIIREFNLNELYQKSKKLNKTKGDKVCETQFPTVPEEEEPEQAEESESKKDK